MVVVAVVVVVCVHKVESFFASLNLTRHPHLSLWVFSPILYALITIILFNQQFQMIGRRRGSSGNGNRKKKKLSNCRISLNDDMFASTTINYRLVPFLGRIENASIIPMRSDPIRSVRSFQPYDRLLGRSIARSLVGSFIHSFCLFICGSISVAHFQLPLQYIVYLYIYIQAKAKDRFESGQCLFHVMTWLSA